MLVLLSCLTCKETFKVLETNNVVWVCFSVVLFWTVEEGHVVL